MPYAAATPQSPTADRASMARSDAEHQTYQHASLSNGGASASQSVELLGDSVIPIVNKLQDIFSQLGSAGTIDLPQVAVVGSQSSGKSSVLESLVGRDFLPRGSDVVTRRPLVLQLVQCPARPDGRVEEYGEFLHLPGKRFTDFSAIKEEIQIETARETGNNKGISEKQIRLKIFSPNVLTITLVDLPGITKVPVGDQPSDIEARVRTMILSYIKHETCIILAVSPANADLANSDALQMARIADPDGHRTIGVITKLDIMDRGTDARNFLLGSVIPLRLGYVGVINRSQEDIVAKKTVKDALAYEESFFRSRPIYHSLADRCGVAQLARKLNTILVQHIKALLPELKARINAQMVTLQKELASYGEAVEKATMGMVLLNALTKYSQAFTTIIDGKNQGMSTSELSGGARIHYIFQDIFVKSLNEVDPCDDLTDDDIRTALQNATGTKNALFVPEVPFEVLVRRQIGRLLDPALQCARFVYDELVKISHRCEPNEMARFPVLRRRVEETVGTFLREGLSPAETMIGHIIAMEMDYVNTSHPSFIGGSKAVEMALQQQRSSSREGNGASSERSASSTPNVSGGTGSSSTAQGATGGKASRGLLTRKEGSGVADQGGSRATGGHQPNGSLSKEDAANSKQAVSWGISSIFGTPVEKGRGPGAGSSAAAAASGLSGLSLNAQYPGDLLTSDPPVSILLREPPAVLRANEQRSSEETVEIAVTRLLVKSYYDIVRKNIQDAVPKAIMHFLVNQCKRELHSVFIQQLYREVQFEEMLQEKEEVAQKRQRCKDIFRVLQEAAWTLEELPLDPDAPHRQVGHGLDSTGLPANSPYAVVASAAAMGTHTNMEASLAANPYASASMQTGYSPSRQASMQAR